MSRIFGNITTHQVDRIEVGRIERFTTDADGKQREFYSRTIIVIDVDGREIELDCYADVRDSLEVYLR